MQRALRPNEQIELERDLVADYLDIQQNQNTFELLMTRLQQGIGLYEALRQRAFRESFNPLIWIAWILRAPVFIFEKAGLSDHADSALVKLYFWLMRIALLFLIGFAAAKLGVSLPWDRVFPFLK